MSTPVSINSFLSEIVAKRGGPSTPVLYEFSVSPRNTAIKTHLNGLGFNWDTELRFLNYLNNEIQIPGVTFQNSEVRMPYKGIAVKMASARVYNEMDMSFICDVTAMPYKFFRGWSDFIGNVSMGTDVYSPTVTKSRRTSVLRYYDDYTCDLNISKLEKAKGKLNKHNEPYSVRLVNAWPYTISSVPMSQASQNGLVKVTVSLYYEYSEVKVKPSK